MRGYKVWGAAGYTGTMTVSRGRVNFGANSMPGGNVFVGDVATVAGETTIAGNLELGFAGGGAGTGSALLVDATTAGALTATGNLTLGKVNTVTVISPVNGANRILNYGGTLTGGAANLALPAGTYHPGTAFDVATSGQVNLNLVQGDLTWNGATGTGKAGALNGLATNAVVDIAASGTGVLDLNGNNQTLAGITRVNGATSATVTNNGAGPSVLTIHSAAGTSFPGVIQNGTSVLGLTKTGAATFTLTGANTYTGDTLVNEGTLTVNGSLGNTAVTVADGATLNGTVTGGLNYSGTLGGFTAARVTDAGGRNDLVLNWTPVPEPSAGILALAAAGIGLGRRRK